MTPGDLIPTPDAIPVAWGWFQLLLILTFVLHLLVMNAMLGGVLLAFADSVRGQNRDAGMGRQLPWLMAFTINLGVAPLLFVQVLFGHYIYVSSIMMAVWWLSIIVLLMTAYYGLYILRYKLSEPGVGRTFVLLLVCALLLVVSFFFTTNMTLMLRPGDWGAWFSDASGTLLLGDSTLWPRWLHFVIASLAVGGLTRALLAQRQLAKKPEMRAVVDYGMNIFSYATVIQIFIGLWFLIALPRPILLLFMGDSLYATILLLLGVVLAVGVLVTGFRKRVWPTVSMLALLVAVMALMRDAVRGGYLPDFSLADLPQVTQYSPMILFLVTFVGGLVVLGWMLKQAAAAVREG